MEPWNLRNDDTRNADSLPLFLIFCEDEVSEPVYFKYFETELIKVNPIGKQKSKMENVLKALTHCWQEDFMEKRNGVDYLKQQDTQVWCVFDRDNTNIENKLRAENVSFNESIATAESRGLKVAWSNDAFELWVFLHFGEIDLGGNDHNRSFYYDSLTEFFKNIPDKSEDLERVLAIKNSNYKQHFKREKNFRNVVRPYMIPNTLKAIKRANALEKYHNEENDKAFNERIPCTTVHHLVEELLRLGQKKII